MMFSGTCRWVLTLGICAGAMPAGTPGGRIRPETAHDFDCYVQSAEARMDARKTFLLAESDEGLNNDIVRDSRIQTMAPDKTNPHKVAGGQIYDWIGSMFISGVSLDRLVQMLQDYDHRASYFGETIAASKLLCRNPTEHFRYTMRLKEPAIVDVESDVTWDQPDPRHWRCRSYSTNIQAVGKDKGYLRRLNSYWRFAQTDKGVYVEGETITLSDEFSSMARAFGSALLGINPEKSLKHSLESMRESVMKPGLQIANPPDGLPECTARFQPGLCEAPK
jgi:hypothetical protein